MNRIENHFQWRTKSSFKQLHRSKLAVLWALHTENITGEHYLVGCLEQLPKFPRKIKMPAIVFFYAGMRSLTSQLILKNDYDRYPESTSAVIPEWVAPRWKPTPWSISRERLREWRFYSSRIPKRILHISEVKSTLSKKPRNGKFKLAQ